MFLAEVVGTVVSPVQVAALERHTLLLLRPVSPDGRAIGKTRIGLDRVGAGVGDRVLVVDEGNSARQILGDKTLPIKTLVVGFVDYVETGGTLSYDHREAATKSMRR